MYMNIYTWNLQNLQNIGSTRSIQNISDPLYGARAWKENKRLTVNGRLAKQDPSDTKTARQIYDGFSAKGKGTMQANT